MIKIELLINQMLESYPERLRHEINNILDKVDIHSSHFHEYTEKYQIRNGNIKIPYRIYIKPEVFESPQLSEEERRILAAYFTRHNDGYVRQKALNVIVQSDFIYDYEIPFLTMVCGEYVVEILEDAIKGIKKIDEEFIQLFIKGNHKKLQLNEERMISYWSEYYRKESFGIEYKPEYAKWSEYPASYLIEYLKKHGYKSIRR